MLLITLTTCIVIAIYLFSNHRIDNFYPKHISSIWYVLVPLVTISLRLPFLTDLELDVDTSTWMASALSIDHYPDKLWKFLTYTDSRPLTVLPIYLLLVSGLTVNYITTEVLALFFWISICAIHYKIFQYFIPSVLAFITAASVCLFIGSCNASDFTAYNSEFLSILLLSIPILILVQLYKKSTSSLSVLVTGFLLGSVLYAKFQNVPMGLVIAFFMGMRLVQMKKYRLLFGFCLMGILPTALINVVYMAKGEYEAFWINYLFNYFEYSFTTQFQSLPVAARFSPLRIARFLLHYYQSRLFFGTIIFSILTGVYYLLKDKKIKLCTQYPLFIFAFFYTVSSFYAVLQSGNSFGHYLLYLLMPLSLLLVVVGNILSLARLRNLLTFLLIGIGFQICTNLLLPYSRLPLETYLHDEAIVKMIQKHSKETDTMVIWGWMDRLHPLANRACGYSMAHTHHLFLNKSKLLPFRLQYFFTELEKNKPQLFIEDTQGRHAPIPGIFKELHFFPSVQQYVTQHYTLLQTIDGVAIYKRK